MLCYLDKTFCGSDCTNNSCSSHFGDDTQAAAKEWARRCGFDDGAPVCFSDLSKDCAGYRKPGTVAPVLQLQDRKEVA
jgi:hypothetical protein